MNNKTARVLTGVFGVAPATPLALLAAWLGAIGVAECLEGMPTQSGLPLLWSAGALYGYVSLWRLAIGRHPPGSTTNVGLLCGIVAASPTAFYGADWRWELICAGPIAVALGALGWAFLRWFEAAIVARTRRP